MTSNISDYDTISKIISYFFVIFCFLLAILNAKFKMKAKCYSTCKARRNTNAQSLTCDGLIILRGVPRNLKVEGLPQFKAKPGGPDIVKSKKKGH